MKRERRSAKDVITSLANEISNRGHLETNREIKLHVIEVIALRMGWNDLYNRLRFRERSQPADQVENTAEEPAEPWWQK